MTSFERSTSINELTIFALRRSDRKRTKRILKDDFMLPNPFKGKLKKDKAFRLPQNLGSQIRKIEFLTQRTLSTLNYGKQDFSIEMLNEMKEAVNHQQIKLSEFLSIKLTEEKSLQPSRIFFNLPKNTKITNEKQNTPKIYQNTITGDDHHLYEFHKQVIGFPTTQENYKQLYDNPDDSEGLGSSCQEESECLLGSVPRFRKEGSKLLSDNYENNELMYTIEHMIPSWDQLQVQLRSEVQYSE